MGGCRCMGVQVCMCLHVYVNTHVRACVCIGEWSLQAM